MLQGVQGRLIKTATISKRPAFGVAQRQPELPQGELAILNKILQRSKASTRSRVRLGIGDDCALLRLKAGEELAITTDLSIAGRHFRLDWHTAESVGHRTLARGLSDLAAMGAKPVAAFLSLGLPPELTVASSAGEHGIWLERFLDGLLGLAREHKVTLAGGDLAESPLAVADIVLSGIVPHGTALLRSGASPGDLIYVTGSLGGAAAELTALQATPADFAAATRSAKPGPMPHLYPQPRVTQGLWLRKRGKASAAIDLSDGLSSDLAHLCDASGVAAEVEAASLPLGVGSTLQLALDGGEDYELLFTAPKSARIPAKIGGVPITAIGRILAGRKGRPRVTLIEDGRRSPLEPGGWEHFSSQHAGGK